MPELPEVESARRLCDTFCRGKRITHVEVLEAGGGPRTGQFDEIVIEAEGADAVKAHLVGRTVLAAKRHGKQQWWELSGPGKHVAFHFGMTGAFSVPPKLVPHGSVFKRYSVDTSSWPPRFTKLLVRFEDKTEVALTDPRRLARVRFLADPADHFRSSLGWDPSVAMRPLPQFRADLAGRSTSIKAILLDQAYIAGIGNWIADETLYQARIHPASVASALDDAATARLHEKIDSVIKLAVGVDADNTLFPKSWLFHYRWGKGKGGAKLPTGEPITFVTVGGRTSAVVAAVQGTPVKGRKEGASPSADEAATAGEETKAPPAKKRKGGAGAASGGELPAPARAPSASTTMVPAGAGAKRQLSGAVALARQVARKL
jgi:formamidopyrimidine-DNA glycosylase